MCSSTHLRIVGPSLSRKKRLRIVIARKKTNEDRPSTPPATPLIRVSNVLLGSVAEAVAGVRGLAVADAEVLHALLDFVDGALEAVADPARLAGDPVEDQVGGEETGRDDQAHHQQRPQAPRDPVAVEPADELARHSGDHRRDDDGDEDRVGQRSDEEEPDDRGSRPRRAATPSGRSSGATAGRRRRRRACTGIDLDVSSLQPGNSTGPARLVHHPLRVMLRASLAAA